MSEFKKRETANKIRIGDLFKGAPIYEESESSNKKLRFIELGPRQIIRVNIIANIVDKYESEGEAKFATIMLDDGTAQIRARAFGEDSNKLTNLNQGLTIIIIGLLRSYNQEIYILPETVKPIDPRYLLIRKLEIEKSYTAMPEQKEKKKILVLRDEIIRMIKFSEKNEGIDKEDIIMKIDSPPQLITQEIQKLLEEGIIYEPRPGIVRYLG